MQEKLLKISCSLEGCDKSETMPEGSKEAKGWLSLGFVCVYDKPRDYCCIKHAQKALEGLVVPDVEAIEKAMAEQQAALKKQAVDAQIKAFSGGIPMPAAPMVTEHPETKEGKVVDFDKQPEPTA